MTVELEIGPSTVTPVTSPTAREPELEIGPSTIVPQGVVTPADSQSYELLFNRSAKLTLFRTDSAFSDLFPTGVVITDLRFKFEIQRSLTSSPNSFDLWIYNLQASNRTAIERKPLQAQLEAGFNGVNHLIATGDVLFAMSEIKKTEWETLIQCNDGGRAYTYARVNKSYGPNTSYRQILSDVATSMGLRLPANLASDGQLDTLTVGGLITYGCARLELQRLLASFGYTWSIQNGRLQVLRDQDVSSNDAIPIDQGHGMIGTPQFGAPPRSGKTPHISVKMELNPAVEPGALVQITSRALPGGKGKFKVIKVKHVGDTHGQAWHTEAEVLAL